MLVMMQCGRLIVFNGKTEPALLVDSDGDWINVRVRITPDKPRITDTNTNGLTIDSLGAPDTNEDSKTRTNYVCWLLLIFCCC